MTCADGFEPVDDYSRVYTPLELNQIKFELDNFSRSRTGNFVCQRKQPPPNSPNQPLNVIFQQTLVPIKLKPTLALEALADPPNGVKIQFCDKYGSDSNCTTCIASFQTSPDRRSCFRTPGIITDCLEYDGRGFCKTCAAGKKPDEKGDCVAVVTTITGCVV